MKSEILRVGLTNVLEAKFFLRIFKNYFNLKNIEKGKNHSKPQHKVKVSFQRVQSHFRRFTACYTHSLFLSYIYLEITSTNYTHELLA